MSRHKEKGTLEDYRALPMSTLKRAGALTPGRCSTHIWWQRKAQAASIGIFCESRDLLRLNYQYSRRDMEAVQHDHYVTIAWTPCNMGGERPWFLCPDCRRRAGILYLNPDTERFTCRLCAQLNYECQQLTDLDWRIKQSHKLRKKLGSKGNLFTQRISTITKPKYMHWAKYFQLLMQLHDLEVSLMAELGRLISHR